MNATSLYQAGKLDEAVQALGSELRNDPADIRRRTFLFELLCFTGDYSRAEKQLDILADTNKEAAMGTLLYRGALQAERTRQSMFEPGAGGASTPAGREVRAPQPGVVFNGRVDSTIEDADPRIGGSLEVFAAGAYLWLPFEYIASMDAPPPRRIRDLIWIPAILKTTPACKDMELGEVLLPALTPGAWRNADPSIRLGRATAWEEARGAAVPVGQKMLLVEGEEVPILEMRTLQMPAAPAAAE